MVAESGYDGTPAVLLDATENTNIHAFVTVADQLLQEIGIKTKVEAMDWATVTSQSCKQGAGHCRRMVDLHFRPWRSRFPRAGWSSGSAIQL
ncbi:hypothetical protein [Rhizobium leguminosarum]|uniref:hypothetical protein n=1 Tax=Rhizobium leguminosarum TaxID=384 RepID=UPI001649C170|nr:hypothetical protein [Rhizobium leguminosarum]